MQKVSQNEEAGGSTTRNWNLAIKGRRVCFLSVYYSECVLHVQLFDPDLCVCQGQTVSTKLDSQ